MQQTTPKLSGLKQYHLLFVMSLSGVDWVFLLIGAYLADLSYTHISDLLASQLGRLSFPHRSHIPPAAHEGPAVVFGITPSFLFMTRREGE